MTDDTPTALPYQRLAPGQLAAWLTAHPDALRLDARDEAAHARAHLAGSLRLDGRNHEALLMRQPRQRPVLLCCYHGNASQTYARMFCDFGFTQVADVAGGWAAVQALLPPGSEGPVDAQALQAAPAAAPAVPPDLAAWLAAEGYDPGQPAAAGPHGNTPLMHAAWRGHEAALDALLALGVPRDAANHDGNTALWLACVQGAPGPIARLVAAGAPIDHANLTGATVLMYAASAGKPEVVRQLLALGANPHLRTQDDFSALDMAACLTSLQLLRAATRPQAAPT